MGKVMKNGSLRIQEEIRLFFYRFFRPVEEVRPGLSGLHDACKFSMRGTDFYERKNGVNYGWFYK
jgi:hypothetical protein